MAESSATRYRVRGTVCAFPWLRTPSPGGAMSYQFSLDQSNRSLRFPVLVMAGIFSAVIGAYTFAACNERTPNQAAAGEAVVSEPGAGTPGSSEQPARGITGPLTLQIG